MISSKRSRYDDDGAYMRIVEYEDNREFDSLVVRFSLDNESLFTVDAYRDGQDNPEYTMAFQTRQLTFEPISIIGRGSSEELLGVSPNADSYTDTPSDVEVALNSIGLATVPEGSDWIDV